MSALPQEPKPPRATGPTATDLARAQRLLELLDVKATPAKVKALAVELKSIHDVAVSCAVVRAEREFRLEARDPLLLGVTP